MKDIFARCFKKTPVQVCTVIICSCRLAMSCVHVSCYCFLHLGMLIHNTDWCLFLVFRRLKINHESHEFILQSGTIVNNHILEMLNFDFWRVNLRIGTQYRSQCNPLGHRKSDLFMDSAAFVCSFAPFPSLYRKKQRTRFYAAHKAAAAPSSWERGSKTKEPLVIDKTH